MKSSKYRDRGLYLFSLSSLGLKRMRNRDGSSPFDAALLWYQFPRSLGTPPLLSLRALELHHARPGILVCSEVSANDLDSGIPRPLALGSAL